MTDFMGFIQDNLMLSSIFVFLLCAVLMLELKIAKSKSDISVAKAIDLINHSHAVVFDFRASNNYAASHIVNAINLNLADIDANSKKIVKYKSKPVILVAENNAKSAASAKLNALGFSDVFCLKGGMDAWISANMPLVKS